MSISIGLAKVSGAIRCNRWSQHLEGESHSGKEGSLSPTIDELFNDTDAYIKRIQNTTKRKSIKK